MAGMTQAELKELIQTQTLPLITDVVGEQVADIVRQQIEAVTAPLKQSQSDIAARMLALSSGDGNGHAKPQAREKGMAAARFMRAVAAAKLEQSQGNMTSPDQILTRWGDIDLAKMAVDARTKAMAATDAAAGGFLVPTQFSQDVIELLRPASIVRSLNPLVIPMPTGSLRIPKITTGATAAYQGENANITASQPVVGQVVLSFKKLTALVPVSNDLLRYSSPSADTIVRDDVVRAIAQRENQAFLRDAGTDATPKGMLNWAPAANRVASTGTALANVVADLSQNMLTLMNANIPEGRWAWLMSPRNFLTLTTIANANGFFVFRDEMVQRGTLWGFPFGKSTQVPGTGATGELYLTNMADAVIGEAQNMIVDASMEAAYVDSTGTMIAAYSQDQTVVRAITEHDFAMRRAESVAVITTMSW